MDADDEQRPIEDQVEGGGLYEFDRSRRYILAERDGLYGVWEIGREFAPPVASHSIDDDDGFELAMAEFDRLTKVDRKAQRYWITVLWWVILISAPVWIATSVATQLLRNSAFSSFGEVNMVYLVLSAAQALSYGLFYAGVFVLIATYMRRRLRNEI